MAQSTVIKNFRDGTLTFADNTGTPLTDPRSRGVFGDQDLTFTSDADRAAFVRACEKRGYHVDGRLGGFNFQWAWSSGTVAAQAAIARLLTRDTDPSGPEGVV
jgi:hypothetical protein